MIGLMFFSGQKQSYQQKLSNQAIKNIKKPRITLNNARFMEFSEGAGALQQNNLLAALERYSTNKVVSITVVLI